MMMGIKRAFSLHIFLFAPDRGLAAPPQAGGPATAAGVGRRVLDWFTVQDVRAVDVRVALGPCIGPCCYEVGDDLRSRFAESEQRFFVPGPRGRAHLDLRGINEAQLLAAGVPAKNIARVDDCTHCLGERYYSYRREGAAAGRMISYVGWE
jgi:copper oxidase (laccase) domain-containing protein